MPKRPGGGSRKAAGQGKRKVPPFGRRSHKVTHAKAKGMREKYLQRYKGKRPPLRPGAYGAEIIQKILDQKGCQGIRVYPGVNDEGHNTLLFCGVDAEGNDILAGIIVDDPFICPPYCSTTNGVLEL